jgi:hypothetical protein
MERWQCKGADEPTCLTAPEVGTLRKIYAGPRLKNGQRVFTGFPIGDEDIQQSAQGWLDRSPRGTGAFGVEFFRWMVHKDPAWKLEDFVLDRDYPLAVERMGAIVDSNDPDLGRFIGSSPSAKPARRRSHRVTVASPGLGGVTAVQIAF